jgi:uncharacterized protein YecE (DUF72 family)
MTNRVRIGAVEWRRPSWIGAFYPADMPEEWRLSYYSTQFGCVFLDAAVWRKTSGKELSQWCEDVHSHFVFLLEGEQDSTPPIVLAHKALVIPRDDPRILWFDRNTDLKQLARALASGMTEQEVFLVSRDGELGQMERCATLLELMGL